MANQQSLNNDEQQYIDQLAEEAQLASQDLRTVQTAQKNAALLALADLLDQERDAIKTANSKDLEAANNNELSQAMVDRLTLNDKRIDGMITSLRDIARLTDPVGQSIDGWTLPNGLKVDKLRVPIGVVAIIYESRPNVTIDVGALGLKSSNAVILRGGKEAIHSNKCLAELFQKALAKAGLPPAAIQLVDRTERHLMLGLLRLEDKIDLVVPRGGAGLIRFVTEHSLIPVVKHDKGVCHIYVHPTARKEIALPIIVNAKAQRPGVCNAVETVLIDEAVDFREDILKALVEAGVTLRGDQATQSQLNGLAIEELGEEGYDTEYLSLDVSIKIAKGLDDALQHIQEHSSAHTEAIIAEDYSAIETFLNKLDSAALFVNSSTRFHDGGEFGLGAEVGISTGKLHARGPMGLADLTTSKYVVRGNGQVRS